MANPYISLSPPVGIDVSSISDISFAFFRLLSKSGVNNSTESLILPAKPFQQRFFESFGKNPLLCPKCGDKMQVELKNSTLYMTITIDAGKLTYPLILSDSDQLKFKIGYTLPTSNLNIQFFLKEKRIYAIFERYVFNKV